MVLQLFRTDHRTYGYVENGVQLRRANLPLELRDAASAEIVAGEGIEVQAATGLAGATQAFQRRDTQSETQRLRGLRRSF